MYIESIGITPIGMSGVLFFSALLYPLPRFAVNSITRRPPSETVAICRSGFSISTVPSVSILAAVTSPSPSKFILRFFTSSPSIFSLTIFKFTIISGTSSTTFGIVVNSCAAPSIFAEVIAAPGNEESSILLNEFPIVIP